MYGDYKGNVWGLYGLMWGTCRVTEGYGQMKLRFRSLGSGLGAEACRDSV